MGDLCFIVVVPCEECELKSNTFQAYSCLINSKSALFHIWWRLKVGTNKSAVNYLFCFWSLLALLCQTLSSLILMPAWAMDPSEICTDWSILKWFQQLPHLSEGMHDWAQESDPSLYRTLNKIYLGVFCLHHVHTKFIDMFLHVLESPVV